MILKPFYYNSEVFNGDPDYIIGGVHIEGGVSYADVRSQMTSRIRKIVREYISRTLQAGLQADPSSPITEEDACQSVREILKDALGVDTNANSPEYLAQAIIESPQATLWLARMQGKFTALKKRITWSGRVENNFSSTDEQKRVEQLVNETTLEVLLEQLSTVDI